jgi:phage portal protein BeeE
LHQRRWLNCNPLSQRPVEVSPPNPLHVAYANKVGGRVRELIRFKPESVTVEMDERTGEPSFKVAKAGGGTTTYAYDQVIYVPSISVDGVCGVAPIALAREAIAILLVMERYVAKLMGTGWPAVWYSEVPPASRGRNGEADQGELASRHVERSGGGYGRA